MIHAQSPLLDPTHPALLTHSHSFLVVPFTCRCILRSATWSTVWPICGTTPSTSDEPSKLMEVSNLEVAPTPIQGGSACSASTYNSGEDLATTSVESEINNAQIMGMLANDHLDRKNPCQVQHFPIKYGETRRDVFTLKHGETRSDVTHTKGSQVGNFHSEKEGEYAEQPEVQKLLEIHADRDEHFKENRKFFLSSMKQNFIGKFFFEERNGHAFCSIQNLNSQLRFQDSQIFRRVQEYEAVLQEHDILRAELQKREREREIPFGTAVEQSGLSNFFSNFVSRAQTIGDACSLVKPSRVLGVPGPSYGYWEPLKGADQSWTWSTNQNGDGEWKTVTKKKKRKSTVVDVDSSAPPADDSAIKAHRTFLEAILGDGGTQPTRHSEQERQKIAAETTSRIEKLERLIAMVGDDESMAG